MYKFAAAIATAISGEMKYMDSVRDGLIERIQEVAVAAEEDGAPEPPEFDHEGRKIPKPTRAQSKRWEREWAQAEAAFKGFDELEKHLSWEAVPYSKVEGDGPIRG